MKYEAFWEPAYAPKVPKLVPRLSGVNFKLAVIGRIPSQELHFRCCFGLTVNLSKSFAVLPLQLSGQALMYSPYLTTHIHILT
jgi:hypothetical protein